MFMIIGPLYTRDQYFVQSAAPFFVNEENKYLSNVSLIIQNDCFEMVMLTTIVNICVNCGGAGVQPYLMA